MYISKFPLSLGNPGYSIFHFFKLYKKVQVTENLYELKESEAFHDGGTPCRGATLALLAARYLRCIRSLVKVDETSNTTATYDS